MGRTAADVIAGMIARLQQRQPTVELTEGTPEHDVMVRSPAIEFQTLYDQQDQISAEQALATASQNGLQIIGSNFSVSQRGAARSQVTVNFFMNTAPTSVVTIPIGTIVSTQTGSGITPVQFQTVQEIDVFPALASSYLNPSTGKYEVPVLASAITGGVSGNVGAGTITAIVGSVSGIDGVYNPASAVGGLDAETIDQYAGRLAQALAGNNVGTSDGYYMLVSAVDGVAAVLIVGNGLSPRDTLGAVDIVIKGTTINTYTDIYTPLVPAAPSDFVLTQQPVVGDGPISVVDSVLGPLTQNTHWSLVKDTSTIAGSVIGNDVIHFTPPFPGSSPLSSVTISYQFNQLITILQSLLNTAENDTENTSVLAIWGTEVPIDISANIKVTPGFDSSPTGVVVQAVQTALTQYLDSLSIGASVDQSLIIATIRNTPGVADAQIPLATFQSSDSTIQPDSFGNLDIATTKYATPGTITVTPVA